MYSDIILIEVFEVLIYFYSQDHIEDDVNLFASWGIDSLKLDGCYCNTSEFSTGKDIFLLSSKLML